MAETKAKPEKPKELTHAEKLQKKVDDVRFSIVLLAILCVVLLGWNLWIRRQASNQASLIRAHENVREELGGVTTPEFTRRVYRKRFRDVGKRDIREEVKTLCQKKNVRFNENFGKKKSSVGASTTEEYVVVPDIKGIEMDRLVDLLVSIRVEKLDVWCTAIDGLSSMRDEEKAQANHQKGWSVLTTERKPVYNIKGLRFSRFYEKKGAEEP
ncbi:MAG: hypothetical protein AB7F75_01895 [Planctomycetota bacterium]